MADDLDMQDEDGRGGDAAPSAHRHCRTAECRQIDAGQCDARRGAHDHRAGGRHHPRRDRLELDLAGPVRCCCSIPPGLRRKMRVEGKAEELSVGDALKAIRFAEVVVLLLDAEQPFEKQDLADRRSDRAGGTGSRHRRQQMGPGARARQARSPSCARSAAACCRRSRAWRCVPVSALDRQGPRQADARPCSPPIALWNTRLPTHCAQSMAARRRRRASAAGGVGAAHQAQIHHPGQCAAADLRAVLLAAEGAARLLCALSRQLVARELRHAGRADQAASAQGRQSLCARSKA